MAISLRVYAMVVGIFAASVAVAQAQQRPAALAPYVKVEGPVVVLEHVRVIDGTGVAPMEDMRVTITAGKIATVESEKAAGTVAPGAKILESGSQRFVQGTNKSTQGQ